MSGHGFSSAFATELDAYLAFKANMGFTGASRIWYLKQFDSYCAEHDRTVFDKDTVEGWVGVQLQRSGRYRSWMSYIRDVARWMTMNGIPGAYVLSDWWKAPVVAAHPYLLSRHDIELFFAAAARMQTPCPWRWQAVAFFTLMIVRAANRRNPRPADRSGRPRCRAHRHHLVQRTSQPQAAAD